MGYAHISIHALREEGDFRRLMEICGINDFYPRPPRGGRPGWSARSSRWSDFYPRPPRGGRQPVQLVHDALVVISIHALREEGDAALWVSTVDTGSISIHALREEGDGQRA